MPPEQAEIRYVLKTVFEHKVMHRCLLTLEELKQHLDLVNHWRDYYDCASLIIEPVLVGPPEASRQETVQLPKVVGDEAAFLQ